MTQVLSRPTRGDRIRRINDHCRTTFTGCMIVTTAAFAEMDAQTKALLLYKVRTFKSFSDDNDPHHEHDLALFNHDGERYFWSFSYHAPDMEHGSEDPSNVEMTRRVLTIGHAGDM
jgi:hypothetical protein